MTVTTFSRTENRLTDAVWTGVNAAEQISADVSSPDSDTPTATVGHLAGDDIDFAGISDLEYAGNTDLGNSTSSSSEAQLDAAVSTSSVGHQCRPCGPRSHARLPFDAKNRTPSSCECECDRGYYRDQLNDDILSDETSGGGQGCRACDLCPHGYGAMRSCSPLRNSACRRCPSGTYSSVLSSTLACFPCTACEPHQIALQPCTLIQNTICVDGGDIRAKQNKVAHKVQSTHLTSTSGQNGNIMSFAELESDHSVWPIYCALFGALILALLAYVVLRRFRVKAPRSHGDAKRRQPMLATNQQHLQQHRVESDVISIQSAWMDCHFNQLSVDKRRNLEALLNVQRNDKKDWRGLARELGYKSGRFACLDNKVPIRKLESNYAGFVLNEWAKSKNAKFHVLVAALYNLERHDAVDLLCHDYSSWTERLLRTNAPNVIVKPPSLTQIAPPTVMVRRELFNNSSIYPSALLLPSHNQLYSQRALDNMV